jgi:hypothetical protein
MEVLGSKPCGVNGYPVLKLIVGVFNHQENIEIINELGHNHFLPNPFQFIIPLSTNPRHSIKCIFGEQVNK